MESACSLSDSSGRIGACCGLQRSWRSGGQRARNRQAIAAHVSAQGYGVDAAAGSPAIKATQAACQGLGASDAQCNHARKTSANIPFEVRRGCHLAYPVEGG